MSDFNEAASTTDAVEDPIGSAAERGIEYLRTIAAELVEAGRSAVQSVLDEQKADAARQVATVAAAVRSAAQSLDQSNRSALARYTDRAAGTVERFAQSLRERNWSELADDVEALARRQPALFIAGAVVAGFLTGRFLWASKGRAAPGIPAVTGTEAMAIERETEAVTAAVASAPGEETLATPAAGVSGTQEMPR
jgi:hypothetical protein